jgi:hypothetical protein
MALDVTGNWVAGDDLRVIEALRLPFGSYTLSCTQNCMNQLEDMSPEAVLAVRDLLAEHETAKNAQSTQNLSNTEGKTLVKADVLEWERNGASQMSGPQAELARIHGEIANYFAFCPCISGTGAGYGGVTYITRS